MSTITIVIKDLPKGRGFTVQTDAAAPCVGQPRSMADSAVMDILRQMQRQATDVQYGTASAALAGELLDARTSDAAGA
jgi:hypothetical protein